MEPSQAERAQALSVAGTPIEGASHHHGDGDGGPGVARTCEHRDSPFSQSSHRHLGFPGFQDATEEGAEGGIGNLNIWSFI